MSGPEPSPDGRDGAPEYQPAPRVFVDDKRNLWIVTHLQTRDGDPVVERVDGRGRLPLAEAREKYGLKPPRGWPSGDSGETPVSEP